jgi:hypothetical protein
VPGRRLSHQERRLAEFWDNPPAHWDQPLLRQLRIEGGQGLRGVARLVVPIAYPLTVICGRNGVGSPQFLVWPPYQRALQRSGASIGEILVQERNQMFERATRLEIFFTVGAVLQTRMACG